eukprot:597856-Rhodomonas_salina.1
MSGTHIAIWCYWLSAIGLRARYAMSGTDVAYGATSGLGHVRKPLQHRVPPAQINEEKARIHELMRKTHKFMSQ